MKEILETLSLLKNKIIKYYVSTDGGWHQVSANKLRNRSLMWSEEGNFIQ